MPVPLDGDAGSRPFDPRRPGEARGRGAVGRRLRPLGSGATELCADCSLLGRLPAGRELDSPSPARGRRGGRPRPAPAADEEVELALRSAPRSPTRSGTLGPRGAGDRGRRAYGYALAARRGEDLDAAYAVLAAARPTAVNLVWALDADAGRPEPERARALHADGGRALPADGRARGRALRARHARPHALQRGRARDRRLRHGGRRDPARVGARARRARVGRRDAAAAPGLAAHRLGARAPRRAVRGDRRRGRGVADGGGRGRLRRHRRRPDRGERRHGEQDRHVRRWRCSPRTTRSRSTSSRRPRPSTSRRRPAPRSRSRSATGGRGHDPLPGAQPGVRRDTRRR